VENNLENGGRKQGRSSTVEGVENQQEGNLEGRKVLNAPF